jgi:hypothetical protein
LYFSAVSNLKSINYLFFFKKGEDGKPGLMGPKGDKGDPARVEVFKQTMDYFSN